MAEKRKIYVITFANVLVSFLDVLALAMGSVVALNIIPLVQSKEKNLSATLIRIQEELSTLVYLEIDKLLIILTIVLIILMSLKTYFSLVLIKKSQTMMGKIVSRYSSNLLRRYLELPANNRKKMDESDFLKTFNESVDSLIFQTIGNKLLVIHEIIGLFIVFIPIMVVAPLVTLIVLILAIIIRLTIDKYLINTSRNLGISASQLIEISNRKLLAIRHIEDETKLYGTITQYLEDYKNSRMLFAQNKAERLIQQSKPKSYLELLILVSLIPLVYVIWIFYSIQLALMVLSMVLILIIRLTPAISRLMSLRLSILQHKSLSEIALKLDAEQKLMECDKKVIEKLNFGKVIEIRFKDVELSTEDRRVIYYPINKVISGPGIVLLSGANGAGKSTIFKYLIGKYRLDKGSIEITVTRLNLATPISYLPQHPYDLKSGFEENILLHRDKSEVLGKNVLEMAMNVYKRLNGGKIANMESISSSGGEFQKIAIARSICADSEIVIMDEPTTYLDSLSVRNLSEILIEISKSRLFLIATHDIELIKQLNLDESQIWNLDESFFNNSLRT